MRQASEGGRRHDEIKKREQQDEVKQLCGLRVSERQSLIVAAGFPPDHGNAQRNRGLVPAGHHHRDGGVRSARAGDVLGARQG